MFSMDYTSSLFFPLPLSPPARAWREASARPPPAWASTLPWCTPGRAPACVPACCPRTGAARRSTRRRVRPPGYQSGRLARAASASSSGRTAQLIQASATTLELVCCPSTLPLFALWSADGYVRAEAVGAIILALASPSSEPSSQSLLLLAGSAVNQDGRSSSLTAPNGPSQQEAVNAALRAGELAAWQVAHLQMHGTGGLGCLGVGRGMATLKRAAATARSQTACASMGAWAQVKAGSQAPF